MWMMMTTITTSTLPFRFNDDDRILQFFEEGNSKQDYIYLICVEMLAAHSF